MTEAEAIARLKDHFRIHDDGRPTPKLDEAVDIAIKALEKQTAKKPKLLLYVYKCPNCEDNFLRTQQKFCDECGQRLDWRV